MNALAPRLVLALLALLVAGCPSKTPERRTPAAPTLTTQPAGEGVAHLLLMADIRGVLRPCGCTPDLQRGGFDRLVPFLAAERARNPGAALLHAGPIFFEGARVDPKKAAQRERQSEVAAQLLRLTGVEVAQLAAADVAAADGRLDTLVAGAQLPLTAANLELEGGPRAAPWTVKRVGDLQIGVFALADPAQADALGARGRVTDVDLAATRAVAALAPHVDAVVLLSELGLRETKRLVRRVSGVDFAVVGGMGEHPAWLDEAELVGQTRVMQFHREGRYLGRLTIRAVRGQRAFVDASRVSPGELEALDERIARLRGQIATWEGQGEGDREVARGLRSARHHLASLEAKRADLGESEVTVPTDASSFSFTLVPLNWDLPQDDAALAIMDAFDEELAAINIAAAGSLPEPAPGQAVYVGVEACYGCHEDTRAYYEADRHSHAWETLERGKKTFDAECVSCHVTGYGQAGGSLVGQTAGREDVQCESCHGPGSLHAEEGDAALIVTGPPADTCVQCHNKHHSPGFDFATYRQKLIVPGHGLPLE